MTITQFLKDHEKAVARATKRATRSRKSAIAFLVRAGILEKDGNKLAKPYR